MILHPLDPQQATYVITTFPKKVNLAISSLLLLLLPLYQRDDNNAFLASKGGQDREASEPALRLELPDC